MNFQIHEHDLIRSIKTLTIFKALQYNLYTCVNAIGYSAVVVLPSWDLEIESLTDELSIRTEKTTCLSWRKLLSHLS